MFVMGMALRNLRQMPRRTLLLSAALGLSALFLVLVQSYMQGVKDQVQTATLALVGGHLNVTGFTKPRTGASYGLLPKDAEVRRHMAALLPRHDVVARIQGVTKAISSESQLGGLIVGIDPATEQRLMSTLKAQVTDPEDAGPRGIERLAEPGTIVLFEEQAEQLRVRKGDPLTMVGETLDGRWNTVDVTVAAVVRTMGPGSIYFFYTNRATAARLLDLGPDAVTRLLFYLDDAAALGDLFVRSRVALEQAGYKILPPGADRFFAIIERTGREKWRGTRLRVSTWREDAPFFSWRIEAANSFSFFIFVVLSAVIAVGVINTMWIAVRERRREIGALRAMGMSRFEILRLFLFESAILGVVGALAGTLAAWGMAAGLNSAGLDVAVAAYKEVMMTGAIRFALRPGHLVAAVAGLAVVTTVAALWPSWRAARLAPTAAMAERE